MGVSADTDTRWYRPIPDTGIVRTLFKSVIQTSRISISNSGYIRFIVLHHNMVRWKFICFFILDGIYIIDRDDILWQTTSQMYDSYCKAIFPKIVVASWVDQFQTVSSGYVVFLSLEVSLG